MCQKAHWIFHIHLYNSVKKLWIIGFSKWLYPYFGKKEIIGSEDLGCIDMTIEWGEF
jgi:hypothetical protein